MRIGLITDGRAEFSALPRLYERIATDAQFVKTLYADMQPYAPPRKIARATETAMRILATKSATLAVVCIDHEDRNECVPEWKDALEAELKLVAAAEGIPNLAVVMKHRMFENWLVADPAALGKMKARFTVDAGFLRKVEPNKADSIDAHALLERSCKAQYEKVADAKRICTQLDPMAAAKNSRSFRRFLRVVGCEAYEKQSKRPAV